MRPQRSAKHDQISTFHRNHCRSVHCPGLRVFTQAQTLCASGHVERFEGLCAAAVCYQVKIVIDAYDDSAAAAASWPLVVFRRFVILGHVKSVDELRACCTLDAALVQAVCQL